jgi:multidrug efflux pump subunit AcrA (membrane-fusion protein)
MMTSATSTDPLRGLFDDGQQPRRWWQRRGTIVTVAVTIVAVLVVSFAMGAFGASGASYRSVVVTKRAVDAELTGVATIEPTSQATVGFPNSGTVASVSVKVGDEVAAGDLLAKLDTTTLEQQLHEAQQTLADASLALSNGLAGIKSTTGGSGPTARNISTFAASDSRIVFTAASVDPELAAAQQAVLDGQVAVDAAMTTASTALDSAIAVCTPSSSDDPSADSSDDPSASLVDPRADPADPDPGTCTKALQAVLDAQKGVQTAQNELAAASIAYDELLVQRAATPTNPSKDTPSSAPSSGADGAVPDSGADTSGRDSGAGGVTPDSGAGGSGPVSGAGVSAPDSAGGFAGGGATTPDASGARGSTSSAPSSADLVAYQKAVDAAQAEVAAAQEAIDQATVTTPITGTVVAVAMTVGESVDDPTSQNITIQGTSGYEATTTVGVDRISAVEVGQRATVTPDSSHSPLAGTVAAISVAPVSSSSTAAYRVTVALEEQGDTLNNGTTGTVTIVTEQSGSGLAVPTSAVTNANGRHFVTVVDDGSTRQVAVDVGVIGREWTEVTSGLTAGQRVVIADLGEPLPSSATSSDNAGTGITGPGGFQLPAGGRFAPGGGLAGR